MRKRITMGPFLQYLISHKEDIVGYQQLSFYWKARYQTTSVMDFQEFRQVYEDLPEPLSRQMVVDIFKTKDPYYSFIAAMVWGGINASRPMSGHPGDYSTTDFYSALKMGRKEIEDRLKLVQRKIEANDNSYPMSIWDKDTAIKGVGESFYTKIFYFLGQTTNNTSERIPLIYDRWGRYMHASLLLDQSKERFFEFYTPKFNSRRDFDVRYLDYLSVMKDASENLGLSDSGQLESFLFGTSLQIKSNRTDSNPRFWMKSYVEKNLRR